MQAEKKKVEALIKTYLNNKSNSKGLDAHNTLARMALHNKDVQQQVEDVANKMSGLIQEPKIKDDFKQCILRIGKPSAVIKNTDNNSPQKVAQHVFDTKQVNDNDPFHDKMMDIIRDEKNYEKDGNDVKFKIPDNNPNFGADEQQKMYRIIMGATSNELGATILAMRPAEFTITLGDVSGDLDVNAAQQNLENRVEKYLQTLQQPKPDAPKVTQEQAPPAPTPTAQNDPEPSSNPRSPLSMDPSEKIKRGE